MTKELETFSVHQATFEKEGICMAISPPLSTVVANNKAMLLWFLFLKGAPVPKYKIVSAWEEFREAVRFLGFLEKPVCFKPPISNGGRGFRIIDDTVDASDILLNQKPNSTYIHYDEVDHILADVEPFPILVVMEYLPGPEYSVDMLCDHGEPLYTIPRLRQTIKEGITTVGVTENNKEIINYCEQIARCLNLHGNVGIQVKANEDGEYRILEVNPRLQGSVALSVASGVNLPYLGVKLALGEEMPRDLKVKWGMKMYRHYEEVFIEEES